jgi:hypothetical protein
MLRWARLKVAGALTTAVAARDPARLMPQPFTLTGGKLLPIVTGDGTITGFALAKLADERRNPNRPHSSPPVLQELTY